MSLKWAAADISRPPRRSLLGRAELARHPAASPHGRLKLAITAARAFHHLVLKLAPILLAAKRIMLRPAHDEIDIAAADSEQQSRLLQSGIVVLVPYRAAISAGSGST